MKNKLFGLLVVFVCFWLTSPVLAGSTRVTKDGIQFPDGTTQTTSSTGGSGLWSANGFKIYYSSGNVGIGINDPNERFEVEGNIGVSGTGNGIKFPDGTVQTTASAPTWHQILPASERFQLVMNDDAAVLDKETGLVWERSPYTGTKVWNFACNHCFQREVGGRKGWRLPTVEELSSLVDTSQSYPVLPAGHPFLNVLSQVYWSSTTSAYNTGSAWYVNFGNGFVTYYDKNQGWYVWCVRGGYGHDAY